MLEVLGPWHLVAALWEQSRHALYGSSVKITVFFIGTLRENPTAVKVRQYCIGELYLNTIG
jgi:hypothetical protein